MLYCVMQQRNAKFEGHEVFPSYTGYYSDVDAFQGRLSCPPKLFSSPLPVGSDHCPHFIYIASGVSWRDEVALQ